MPDPVRTPPPRTRRAIVVGGSMSGLFAALSLARHGWTVDVFERTAGALDGRGAGIVAQPGLAEALAGIGIATGRPLGVAVDRRRLLDISGRTMLDHRCPQIVTSWEYIHHLLRGRLAEMGAQVRYHDGAELRHVEIGDGEIGDGEIGGGGPGTGGGNGVVAHFGDGRRASADLLIGADGIRSTVRQQLFPDAGVQYAGYVAWRGLVEERTFPPDAHAAVFADFVFGLPPGEQFIGYPVAGSGDALTPGHLRYNFVWYRPTDEHSELPRLLTDTAGHTHTQSIPPPMIRPETRAEMRAAAARLLAPQLQAVVALTAQPFLQPIYDLESQALARGPVAIVGDAAFVARPHLGAGVIKAFDDILALVAGLDAEADIATALRRYQAERMPTGRRMVARAREMGAAYRAVGASGLGQPRAGLSSADADYARSVVVETALLDFVRAG